jgi:hypothetical protein
MSKKNYSAVWYFKARLSKRRKETRIRRNQQYVKQTGMVLSKEKRRSRLNDSTRDQTRYGTSQRIKQKSDITDGTRDQTLYGTEEKRGESFCLSSM